LVEDMSRTRCRWQRMDEEVGKAGWKLGCV
jgi:hypothetical protein